jgi:Carboxypeptidase regulatory-like domain
MFASKLRLKVLDHKPCSVPWDEMLGSDRERHCAACDKTVHNFAAMRPKEIERLLVEKQGKLCARVTHHADDSIAMLECQSQPSIAAVVLAASLAVAGTAVAQTPQTTASATKAHLTGTVLRPDGSGPVENAWITLIANQKIVAGTKSNKDGTFSLEVAPGNYDVEIRQNFFLRAVVLNAALHEGEQFLPPIRTALRQELVNTTVGTFAITYHYPISYLFKHPLQYLKHLPHNFA